MKVTGFSLFNKLDIAVLLALLTRYKSSLSRETFCQNQQ
jgi:hypothetical protein